MNVILGNWNSVVLVYIVGMSTLYTQATAPCQTAFYMRQTLKKKDSDSDHRRLCLTLGFS